MDKLVTIRPNTRIMDLYEIIPAAPEGFDLETGDRVGMRGGKRGVVLSTTFVEGTQYADVAWERPGFGASEEVSSDLWKVF